jgi:hypothetical protein
MNRCAAVPGLPQPVQLRDSVASGDVDRLVCGWTRNPSSVRSSRTGGTNMIKRFHR